MSGASPPRAAVTHRWQALTVTSLGALLAPLNSGIPLLLIALRVFAGIGSAIGPVVGGWLTSFDRRGNLMFLVALTGLLVALSMRDIEGWTHPPVITGAVLFVPATPLFLGGRTMSVDRLLDVTLFRNMLFAVANLTQCDHVDTRV